MGTAEKETKVEAAASEQPPKEAEKKDPALLTLEDVREHCRLLERSVVSKESRFAVRVLRGLPATRKKLNSAILKKIISGFYTHSVADRDTLLGYIPDDVIILLIKARWIILLLYAHFIVIFQTKRNEF